ncbi:trehalase family glycosidase [Mesorhizobium sp.]|uniref:trehalase family glycosidase n=1 Tax=Mesorhizobium sp. TaxID=1871066 RepID=UPI0025C1F38A|nr:trehalase family glycosidase [Mesorhizobium sp.]
MEILDYIEAYWPRIVRNVSVDEGTLIGLPRPYMAPAEDPIFQEMFYWDSYFTAVGLSGTPREQLVVDMAENMVAMLRRFGMIPNASRLYFLSRSQPPLSTAMFRLAFETKEARGDADACAFLAEAMNVSGIAKKDRRAPKPKRAISSAGATPLLGVRSGSRSLGMTRKPQLGEPIGELVNKPLINNDNGGPGGCLGNKQNQTVRDRWDHAALKSVPMFFDVSVPPTALPSQ